MYDFLDLFWEEIPSKVSFAENSSMIAFKIESAIKKYLSALNAKNVLEMTILFALTEQNTSPVCARKMEGIGGWRCLDCIKNENTIFCQGCWSKMREKHKDHNIVYITSVNGTCDCGDPNTIDKKYFCPNHKGPLTSDLEVHNYTNKILGEKIANELKRINRVLFKEMAKFIIRAIQEKRTNDLIFQDTIFEFIDFLDTPCTTSKACMHLIAELLLENFPFKTKHVCLQMSKGKGKLIKSSVFNHDCTCPFIRLLMPFWPKGKERIIYSFLYNYKLRKTMGLCYFLLYEDLIKNYITEFIDLSVQIIFDEVSREACSIEGLIDKLYECMPDIVSTIIKKDNYSDNPNKIKLIAIIDELSTSKELINTKKYLLLRDIIYKLKYDTIYMMKYITLKYLGNNLNIIFHLIDTICYLHNLNSVKPIVPHPIFKKDIYNIDLIDSELFLLDVFSILISIFNFESEHLVKEVFEYFSKKINNKKYIIDSKEYTFHIPLYRAFSIFLNRYCFYYANKNNSDVLHGLQSAIKIIPNYKECFKIMIESIYKVFGFITACGEEFFGYYGENMVEYEYVYYYNKQFIFRDFCLMKYLLAVKDNQKYFSFDKILSFSQVENSNKPLEENILKGKKMISPDKWLNNENKKYLKFSSKILRIILNILRNNTCLIWNLSGAYSCLQLNKIQDNLIKDIISKDKNNFIELVKELIVNNTCIKENLAFYSDIYDSIYLCLKEILGENNVREIILSMNNKTLTQEKKAKFSIKDEYLKYLDLNYILYPVHKSTVEKYISDFKKNIVTIFNTHFYPVNKFESKLAIENYKQVYFNEGNFDFLFRFTAFILERQNYLSLNEFFLSVLLNYLSTFFCLENDQFIFFRDIVNKKIVQLIHVLEKNNLTDEMQKSYCHFIVQKIAEHEKIYTISFKKKEEETTPNSINTNSINEIKEPKNEINVQPVKKSAKLTMKDKMKNKFKKKNENLSNKFGIENIKLEKKKNNEACIYCLKPIETDDLKKPFGKIGDFIFDNFLSNAFFQVIRKEFKKYYDADLKLNEFDNIYYQPAERKNIRIISCNHYIHFSCHFEAFMHSNLKNSLNIFQCPLCNKLSETCIPMLDHYTEEESFGVFKGYKLKYVYNYGKNNLKIMEERINILKNESTKFVADLLDEEKDEEETLNNEKKNIIDLPNYQDSEIKEDMDSPNFNIDNFKKEYPDFINACKHFVEGFIGMKLLINTVNLETNLFRSIMDNILTIFSIQFRDLFDFFENIDERKTTMNLWKNFFLSMRLLIKLKILDEGFFFCKFYSSIEELKNLQFDTSLNEFLNNDRLKLKLSQLLFLICLLFDYEEIEGYESYIIYMSLPIYGFGFFYKDIYFKNTFTFFQDKFLEAFKEENLYEFLKSGQYIERVFIHVIKLLLITKLLMKNDVDCDKVSLDVNNILDLLNLPELKDKSFLEVLECLEKSIALNISNKKGKNVSEIFNPKKNYKESLKIIFDDIKKVVDEGKCDKVLSPSLFGSCIPNIYNFIELPELAIDLEYQYYNKECEACKKTGQKSLICLDCGKKVCDLRACMQEVNGIKVPAYIAHTKTCGGGRSAFLQSYNCSVLFVSNKVVFKKFVPFYVNQFGEGITKTSFGSEFKLSKDEVKKALMMFTKYTYSNAPIIP